ncbi:MAG: imidazoleglycerol-phosphate dehydratase HisB [Chloroherpetonaceae bacterium]|nr:imidazoleglycerol-phosphate dehydratase HisB [Chloroherpetonaceae bacterium]MDW8019128.1 imidazoleglycerol-phosphate dehydratase HisB [Chloroherpetonaceae bacterium]
MKRTYVARSASSVNGHHSRHSAPDLPPPHRSDLSTEPKRSATYARKTKETDITISLTLDGEGRYDIDTGINFLNHMLELFAKHSRIDLVLRCKGDVHIDDHHTVEDVAIALGRALSQALGEKVGIERYGYAYIPMDETLARAVIDLSGRAYLVFNAKFARAKISDMATEMVEHFFLSLSEHLKANVHLEVLYGKNTHHKIEALFKAFAVALRQAVRISSQQIASTKGTLS